MLLQDSINQFILHCSGERRLSESSVKAYSLDLKQFFVFLKREFPEVSEVESVVKNILLAYISDMNTHYTVKTVKRKIASLKGFFNYYEEEGVIEKNPFDKLHIKIKEPFTMPEVMTLREVKKILSVAYKDTNTALHVSEDISEFLHYRNIAVLEFLFATGLRVHELCNLKFSDFDAKSSVIKIFGKGQKERHIYIGNAEVLRALKNYLI